MILNTTANTAACSACWNDTAPTSTQFTVGTDHAVNASGENYIAILFAQVAGFSHFGAYTGNGSATGPTISGLGFKPGFALIKGVDNGTPRDWGIQDSKRDTTNPSSEYLLPNQNNAEATGLEIDFNAGSFQPKTGDAIINENNARYVYACFKETW